MNPSSSIIYPTEIESLRQQLADSQKRNVMLRNALIRIESWNSHSTGFAFDYGSSGVRDFYIEIAKEALDATKEQ